MPADPFQTERELATHANDIKHLQEDMDKLVEDIKVIRASVVKIQQLLAEAEGRDNTLKTGLAVIASLVGGAVVWVLDRVFR